MKLIVLSSSVDTNFFFFVLFLSDRYTMYLLLQHPKAYRGQIDDFYFKHVSLLLQPLNSAALASPGNSLTFLPSISNLCSPEISCNPAPSTSNGRPSSFNSTGYDCCGVGWSESFSDIPSSGVFGAATSLRVRERKRRYARRASRARPQMPPTVPPAIAPAWEFE